jgi:DNA-binding CsgD family transcriptional regulator
MGYEIVTILNMYQGAIILLTLLSLTLWDHTNRSGLFGYIISNICLITILQIYQTKGDLHLILEAILLFLTVVSYFITVIKIVDVKIYLVNLQKHFIKIGSLFFIASLLPLLIWSQSDKLVVKTMTLFVLLLYTALLAKAIFYRKKENRLKVIYLGLLSLGSLLIFCIPLSFETLPCLLMSFLLKDALIIVAILRRNKKMIRVIYSLRDVTKRFRNELNRMKINENLLQRSLRVTEESLLQYSLKIDDDKSLMKEINDSLKAKLDTSTKQSFKAIISKLNKRENGDHLQYFDNQFHHFNKDFFDGLINNYPQLTPNERRLCAFLRMNMNSKEISALTGKSPGSIDVSKYRLRKKVGVKTNKDLHQLLLSVEKIVNESE